MKNKRVITFTVDYHDMMQAYKSIETAVSFDDWLATNGPDAIIARRFDYSVDIGPPVELKAYKCLTESDHIIGVIAAETSGAAKSHFLKTINKKLSPLDQVDYMETTALRAHIFDHLADDAKGRRVLGLRWGNALFGCLKTMPRVMKR